MAAKAQHSAQDNTGSSVLSQTPLPISLASSILASTIPLPEHPLIAYSVYTCELPSTDGLEQLDVARKAVLARNQDRSLVDSLMPVVHIAKDVSALYVFALGSTERQLPGHDALFSLELEHLTVTERSSFIPAGIYPCSAACASRAEPCGQCLHSARARSSPPEPLPRIPLRQPLMLFLQAARDRLIDDIAEASKLHPRGRTVTRMKGGFLLGSILFSSEWGSGWENHVRSRTMIYCHLQVHITFSTRTPSTARLVIQPIMQPTYYLPLYSSLPLPAGVPVVLLPHGVPA
ncbi:hypothetical protein OH76DRAFT_1553636, partial [Lentinus brumalis]